MLIMLEPANRQYVMVGRIAQSHGVDGTVLIIPEIYAPALFDDIDLVRMQNARGDFVPARVKSVRVQQKNDRLSFFVKFDHITDRNEADAIRNFPVYLTRDDTEGLVENKQAKAESTYISFEIRGETGDTIGLVEDVTDNPAHPILMVQTSTGSQLLIPFVDEYITETDMKNEIIYCHHLDQLTDY